MNNKISLLSPRLLMTLGGLWLAAPILYADDWPQWLGPQRDAVWRVTGIVEKFPESGLKVRWRVPVGGGYAGPAVARGQRRGPAWNLHVADDPATPIRKASVRWVDD